MKVLIAYYSFTSVTRNVAGKIAEITGAQIEEITEVRRRVGAGGFLAGCFEVLFDRPARINPLKAEIGDYDLIVLGTPVWAGRPSAPVTAFLNTNAEKIKALALFITHGDEKKPYDSVIDMIEKKVGKKSIASLSISAKDVLKSGMESANAFAEKIKAL